MGKPQDSTIKTWLAIAATLAPGKEPLGLPQPVVWQLQEPVWHVSRGLKGLKGLKRLEGASGSFGPVETERLGLPQPRVWHQKQNDLACKAPSLAAPRASLARFEGFEGFKAFGGSIRQFRATRQRKVWHVSRGLKGLRPLGGASGSFGPVEKERLGLPQPRVWHQERNHLACHSL